MANMVDLDHIVDFYCTAMENFTLCRDQFNLKVHEIHYEDLISNFDGEIKALLSSLDLRWETAVENYQETAIKRGHINTPSYSQVVKPLYTSSSFR